MREKRPIAVKLTNGIKICDDEMLGHDNYIPTTYVCLWLYVCLCVSVSVCLCVSVHE